jgi:hypothetical protein
MIVLLFGLFWVLVGRELSVVLGCLAVVKLFAFLSVLFSLALHSRSIFLLLLKRLKLLLYFRYSVMEIGMNPFYRHRVASIIMFVILFSLSKNKRSRFFMKTIIFKA